MKSRVRVSTSATGVTTATIVLSDGAVAVSRTERVSTTNIKGQIVAAHGRAVLTLGSVEEAFNEIQEAAS